MQRLCVEEKATSPRSADDCTPGAYWVEIGSSWRPAAESKPRRGDFQGIGYRECEGPGRKRLPQREERGLELSCSFLSISLSRPRAITLLPKRPSTATPPMTSSGAPGAIAVAMRPADTAPLTTVANEVSLRAFSLSILAVLSLDSLVRSEFRAAIYSFNACLKRRRFLGSIKSGRSRTRDSTACCSSAASLAASGVVLLLAFTVTALFPLMAC